MDFDANTVGAIGEAKAFAKAAEKGYTVLVPHVHPCRYDLVLEEGGNFTKVQVKTGWIDNGSFRVELRSDNHNYSGRTRTRYGADEIDVFIFYNPQNDCLYWVDYEDAPQTGICRKPSSMEKYLFE